MTINEIQSTLDQLKERHPNLNEGLVLTLLEAGGWDKSDIKDAVALFKVNSLNSTLPHEDKIALPENPELLLSEHNEVTEEKTDKIVESIEPEVSKEKEVKEHADVPKEKESLIISSEELSKDEENYIPHDLPLKPFEASPHIWQFSKYKDVFYGNAPAQTPPKVETKPKIEVEKVIEVPKVEIPKAISVPVPEIKLTKVPLTTKDEVIVAVGALLALVAVLLIVYMYTHGRL